MTTLIKEDYLLFEESVTLTRVQEYGFTWEKFATGKESIPPEGIRFDIFFDGELFGERLKGNICGIDYLTVRADGRLFLDLHATLKTHDGATIKVTESGINENGALQLNMDFHTNDTRYTWLNKKHVWGSGRVDFATGNVSIKAYQIEN